MCLGLTGARNIFQSFDQRKVYWDHVLLVGRKKSSDDDDDEGGGEKLRGSNPRGKMFNMVSTWNKRRRSKSLDQLNPCE